jgi:hypothetical protein
MSAEEIAKISALTERIDNLIYRLDRFEAVADAQFVRRAEFSPVEKLVYGGVGIVLSAVVVASLALILK